MSFPIDATFRPLTEWPASLERTKSPKRSRFDTSWGTTLSQLRDELRHLSARDVVIQIDLDERQIRLDGYPRADARPRSPGVIISFESKHGPQSYPCDTFADWQDNVRAIALTLHNLRAIDRYGVSKRGEQYKGWGALPPAGGTSTTMTATAAADFLARAEDRGADPDDYLWNSEGMLHAYRNAAKRLHPDAPGGSHEAFTTLSIAKRVLEQHHRRTEVRP